MLLTASVVYFLEGRPSSVKCAGLASLQKDGKAAFYCLRSCSGTMAGALRGEKGMRRQLWHLSFVEEGLRLQGTFMVLQWIGILLRFGTLRESADKGDHCTSQRARILY